MYLLHKPTNLYWSLEITQGDRVDGEACLEGTNELISRLACVGGPPILQSRRSVLEDILQW